MVAFEELADGLGGAADGVGFPVRTHGEGSVGGISGWVGRMGVYVPCGVDARRLRLIQPRLLTPRIKAHNQRTDPKRPHTSALRISLLHARHILGDILHRHRILHRQTVTLRLEPCLVDQDACVGVEPGECETDVRVDEGDLGGGDAGVLQLHRAALLAPEHDDVGAFDADGAGAAFDGFEGVFDLEDVAVGGEDWQEC